MCKECDAEARCEARGEQADDADEQTGVPPRSELTIPEFDALQRAREAGISKEAKLALEPQQELEKPTNGKRMSALDAAAKVLREAAGEAMKAKAIIDAMATKGLWTSPKGKTPWATLAAAMRREIKAKADQARFRMAGRGMFAIKPVV